MSRGRRSVTLYGGFFFCVLEENKQDRTGQGGEDTL